MRSRVDYSVDTAAFFFRVRPQLTDLIEQFERIKLSTLRSDERVAVVDCLYYSAPPGGAFNLDIC